MLNVGSDAALFYMIYSGFPYDFEGAGRGPSRPKKSFPSTMCTDFELFVYLDTLFIENLVFMSLMFSFIWLAADWLAASAIRLSCLPISH